MNFATTGKETVLRKNTFEQLRKRWKTRWWDRFPVTFFATGTGSFPLQQN